MIVCIVLWPSEIGKDVMCIRVMMHRAPVANKIIVVEAARRNMKRPDVIWSQTDGMCPAHNHNAKCVCVNSTAIFFSLSLCFASCIFLYSLNSFAVLVIIDETRIAKALHNWPIKIGMQCSVNGWYAAGVDAYNMLPSVCNVAFEHLLWSNRSATGCEQPGFLFIHQKLTTSPSKSKFIDSQKWHAAMQKFRSMTNVDREMVFGCDTIARYTWHGDVRIPQ